MTLNQSFWRAAGLTYLRYLNYSSRVVRAAVKEGVKSEKKFETREVPTLMWRKWTNGKKNPSGTGLARSHSSGTLLLWKTLSGRNHLEGRKIDKTNSKLNLSIFAYHILLGFELSSFQTKPALFHLFLR